MNRIDICLGKGTDSAPADPAHGQIFEPKYSLSSPRRGTKFATFSPLHYEPKYAYPLIVWLHGSGESEAQLRRVMPAISLRNYASIAPRGDACADSGLQPEFSWEQTPSSSSTSVPALGRIATMAFISFVGRHPPIGASS